MKKNDFYRIRSRLFFATTWLTLLPAAAFASSPDWRPTYDLVMMYVNFIIFAAVIVKFGRQPLKQFLKEKKEDVVSEIESLEAEKKRIVEEIETTNVQVSEGTIRLQEMKARLISQGEAKKKQIIDTAEKQSAIMIEEAQKKMANRIFQAKKTLKLELADLAFEQALIQLPKIITDGDNQRLLDEYMASMNADSGFSVYNR